MKRSLLIALAIFLAGTATLFAQAIPVRVSTPTPTPNATEASETVTGRIVRIDVHASTFSVKAPNSRKAIQLKAGKDIDVSQLRRGERVVVTYSKGIATKVEATRATR
jgi:hypothetical protein